jgi:hypothetical protein
VKCLVTFQALFPPQPSLGTEDSLLSEWDIDCRTRSSRITDQLLSKGSLISDEDIHELDWTPDAFKHQTLYSFNCDYSRSLGLSEAIVFRILGVFIDLMNMGGLWYSIPYVHAKIHWSVCMWCN